MKVEPTRERPAGVPFRCALCGHRHADAVPEADGSLRCERCGYRTPPRLAGELA